MELIPGLPDDVARECLIRMAHQDFHTVASTCRNWKSEIQSPDFWRRRNTVGCTQTLILMTQAVYQGREFATTKYLASPTYRLTVFEPATGNWSELNPNPGKSNGLPMFCQLVRVGSELVVLGGWDPATWSASNAVFIYNFLLNRWRRGADMPGVRRSFFACASDSDRTVFVAGGHDDHKNALRSAMVYNVAKDEWLSVADMARERDECKGLFRCGKFHVIGGYPTESQGRFESSAEAFDSSTWQWDQLSDEFLDAGMCPRTCVSGTDGLLYLCRDGEVAARHDATWKKVADLPSEVQKIAYVVAWGDKLLVIGSRIFGEPHTAYVLDTKRLTWTKMVVPEEFCTHVQSACSLEL
ncbi:hypothetical protein UlMin_018088 [Ulmus minor]